jgi:hypothetical protein
MTLLTSLFAGIFRGIAFFLAILALLCLGWFPVPDERNGVLWRKCKGKVTHELLFGNAIAQAFKL